MDRELELKLIEEVKKDPFKLKDIEEQTEDICLAAIKSAGSAVILRVKNQTEKICLEAVKQNGNALQYVKNQTKEICLAAILQDAYFMNHVKHQTEDLYLEAAKINGNVLECFRFFNLIK